MSNNNDKSLPPSDSFLLTRSDQGTSDEAGRGDEDLVPRPGSLIYELLAGHRNLAQQERQQRRRSPSGRSETSPPTPSTFVDHLPRASLRLSRRRETSPYSPSCPRRRGLADRNRRMRAIVSSALQMVADDIDQLSFGPESLDSSQEMSQVEGEEEEEV